MGSAHTMLFYDFYALSTGIPGIVLDRIGAVESVRRRKGVLFV